jgi:toxin ParE1/3/4
VTTHQVIFTPEAEEQLAALYNYIAQAGSPLSARRYTSAIVDYCASLSEFPERGTRRDDLRSGLRITNYKGRTVIAFEISDDTVAILGIFYGGQDYASLISDGDDA